MKKNPPSPATKTYRVWADHVRRVLQQVEAQSPERAYEIAGERPECWEDCFEHEDRDDYRLSHEVQDVATDAYSRVRGGTHCRTCGSEIVESVNDSNFNDGECGACEYQRYKTHRELLGAAFSAYGVLCDLGYHWCFRGKSKRFREANDVIDVLATALNNYGREE